MLIGYRCNENLPNNRSCNYYSAAPARHTHCASIQAFTGRLKDFEEQATIASIYNISCRVSHLKLLKQILSNYHSMKEMIKITTYNQYAKQY